MKKITAIVRPEKLEPLKDALFEAKVSGMTISQVQGCGSQHGWKEYYRGTEVLLNMVPKVKFEIVVTDEEVDPIVDVITSVARTGEVGDGKIFVFPVDEVVRVRTGERGGDAVKKEHDHAMDDLRYFCMSVPERGEDGFAAVSVRR